MSHPLKVSEQEIKLCSFALDYDIIIPRGLRMGKSPKDYLVQPSHCTDKALSSAELQKPYYGHRAKWGGTVAPCPFHTPPWEGSGAPGKRRQSCRALYNSLASSYERTLWASQRTKPQTLPSGRPWSSRRNWTHATVAQLTET